MLSSEVAPVESLGFRQDSSVKHFWIEKKGRMFSCLVEVETQLLVVLCYFKIEFEPIGKQNHQQPGLVDLGKAGYRIHLLGRECALSQGLVLNRQTKSWKMYSGVYMFSMLDLRF